MLVITDLAHDIKGMTVSLRVLLLHGLDVKMAICICNIKINSIAIQSDEARNESTYSVALIYTTDTLNHQHGMQKIPYRSR